MANQQPLISFVTHGRNDGYMGDFPWRLATSINKIAEGVASAGGLDKVEILVGDWGSTLEPLCRVLKLSEDARQVTRFYNVPCEVAARHNGDGVYSYPAAANVPIRRAAGKFIFSMDADAYMPAETGRLLLKISEGEGPDGLDVNRTFFWLSRLHIPYGFLTENRSLGQIDGFIREHPDMLVRTAKCNLSQFRGGAVAIFGKRELFHAVGGYNESLIYWGWADVDIHYRLALQYKPMDLWDFGGLMYHLEHYPERGQPVGNRKLNPQVIPTAQIVNPPDWGAINEPIAVSSLERGPTSAATAASGEERPRNIVISGTNFWNPGDDFVRDGIVRVLRALFRGTPLNFLFYNFNADFFPHEKFEGIGNYVSEGDLERCRESIDHVVIAGLSAGDEIKDLYRWVIANGLEEKVLLIGAGYENNYVADHVPSEPEATIFRKARIVIGRTAKTPGFVRETGVPYVHLNCPAILSVPEVKSIPASHALQRIGFSIQLPHGEGIVNHCCAREQYELALTALRELSCRYQVEVIAHHKTEYFHFLKLLRGDGIPVRFSSFYQDLHAIYPRYDLVITTRLHSSLFANGHGIPGIIINDTERHTHTLEGFPHSKWVNTRAGFDREFATVLGSKLSSIAAEARAFKDGLITKYIQTLQPVLCGNSTEQFASDAGLKEKAIRALLQPGMTVMDVGAHVGEHASLFSSLVGAKGKVIAFEPDPASHLRLAARVAAEKLANVSPQSEVLTSKSGVVNLNQFPEEHSSWNTLGNPRIKDPKDPSKILPIVSSAAVPATTLDEFCRAHQIPAIDYLKLDVAGAELLAMQGARDLLARKAIRYLQFEISKTMLDGLNTTARRLFDYLGEWGYLCHDIAADGAIGQKATDLSAGCRNYIAVPGVSTGDTAMFQSLGVESSEKKCDPKTAPGNAPKGLPIHFFTIVLNGKPFIEHHICALQQLTTRWHWHIVEGVAELNHDTGWSKAGGGKITDEIHSNGLSNDGTTEYLNELVRHFPDQITIYRKPAGCFWDGKLEMVNMPLRNIHEPCLLWQIDADELWTAEQIHFALRLFLARPDKTAAYYYCHYFVGKNRVITTRDTYGNNTGYEWLRTWRFTPGCRWTAHEPPRLCQAKADGTFVDLASINPFRQNETEALDLVFQHYAYTTEAQLFFKQNYYGYASSLGQWEKLQAQTKLPLCLKDYFSWVKDGAEVNTAASQGIVPLLPERLFERPLRRAESRLLSTPGRILFVRPDAIGDAVLAASMLAPLRQKYVGAQFAVLCQEHVAEFWAASPFVDVIISFNKERARNEQAYRKSVQAELQNWAPDLVLNSVFSSEALFEELLHACASAERIGIRGDSANMGAEESLHYSGQYTRQIPSEGHKTELERHRDILRGLGIASGPLLPQLWTTPDDDALAEIFFSAKALEPARTIALFPGSQHGFKIYPHLAASLKDLAGYKAIIFGGAELAPACNELAAQLPFESINLAGKTSLREMASLIRKCRLYIGMDSAGAHIASAVGVPNVVIMGGGHFGRFFPYSALTSVACLPIDCYGCNWRCPHARHHCVTDLAPEVVAEAIQQTMERNSDKPRIFYQESCSETKPHWKYPDAWIKGDVEWVACGLSSAQKKKVAKTAPTGEHDKTAGAGSLPISDSNLADVEKNWNEFGKRDPLWAILTNEDRKNNRWDLGEFFSLGEREVSGVMKYLESLQINFRKGRALDFGCGVGRLTQALCKHFQECHGVDIAASMVEQARSYNRFGAQCYYHLNKSTDLKLFEDGTFDFIYSNIVLQHNRPENSRKFIREFCRVLAPGGLLVFQIPSHPIGFQQTPGDRLPNDAFSAEIKFQSLDLKAVAGTALDLNVTVRNISPVTWPLFLASTSNALKLGNHWLDGLGRSIVHDDARASLPSSLSPGQSVELSLSVCVPGKPGRYILELDMVQEHVCWFANHGSRTARLEIEVAPNPKLNSQGARSSTRHSGQSSEVLVPRMEMHGIAKAEVIEFLKANGASIVDVQNDSNATGWVGYRYCVTKLPVSMAGSSEATTPSEAHRETSTARTSFQVSAIVSTYNSEGFMRACLRDLTAQTLFQRGEMEIIVINSGSQENEEAIVLEFQKEHPNVVYRRTERETLYSAWNRAIQLARGKYIVNANTDDARRVDAFERLALALEANPDADLAYAHCAWTDAANDQFSSGSAQRTIAYPPYHPVLTMFYCMTGCMQFWRASGLKKLKGFNAELKAVGDYEILIRFAKAGMKSVLVPEVLSLFYQNNQGITQQSTVSQEEEVAVRNRARAEVNIQHYFKCDSQESEALAWATLGMWAVGCPVPWLEAAVYDGPFALKCFERAACLAPGNPAVLHNLIIELTRSGKGSDAEIFLSKLALPHAAALREALGRKDFLYAEFTADSALKEIVHPPMPLATAHPVVRTIPFSSTFATNLPVRWLGPIFNPSGYASEAINFIMPLAGQIELGIKHDTGIYSETFVNGLAPSERDTLFFLRDKFASMSGGIAISHNPATGMFDVADAVYRIGRTMFETDRVAADWVKACNQMDEIWVPSAFNVETFAKSGVERDKLFVMPEAVDETEFDPARHEALALPNKAGFNFLAIFEWSSRKAWDVLLSAYLREFSAADDVCLYLRTYLFSKPDGDPSEAIWNLIREHAAKLNLGEKAWPRIHLLAQQVPQAELPSLYKAVDCLVAPSRGEGWGRPHHEAMMMGLPVIATNWSGNTEFMNEENSFLIDYELVDAKYLEPELLHYRGHRWANPSESGLRSAMRQIFEKPELGRAKGAKAREHMLQHYSRGPVARRVIRRLQAIEHKLSTPCCPPVPHNSRPRPQEQTPGADPNAEQLHVTWEGSFLDYGSLSQVNRQITEQLLKDRKIQLASLGKNTLRNGLTNVPELQQMARRMKAQAPRQADITVRHAWPPRWDSPPCGQWVVIQPWEFGYLPKEWVRQLARVDEAWVPSEYVRRVYVDSGVAPEKVKVVPNGVNPALFHPAVPPMKLPTRKSFKFVFVGGTVLRKGPDVLLEAYLRTFTAADDVCLVIKDVGGASVYTGQTFQAQIKAAQAQKDAPEIIYLTDEFIPAEMAALYTACHCLVHPYRGEGFGLPVLEAMACGLPVIVTGGGATDDFATDEFAYRVKALRKVIGPVIAEMPLAHNGWWLEPVPEAVAETMRQVFDDAPAAKEKGLRASEYVRREWTWEKAAEVASRRLQDLVSKRKTLEEQTRLRRARKLSAVAMPLAGKFGNLAAARAHFKAQDYLAAWNSSCDAIRERPFHPEAFLLLAEIARAANDMNKARACLELARRKAPRWKAAQHFPRVLTPRPGGAKVQLPELDSALTTHTPRLSVCLIVKNEEKFLGRCLESVREIAEQIIVVDTGSSDRSCDIASRYGAEMYSFKWCDDFSAARNAALERATGDWILMIDADEELPTESRETLRKELTGPNVIAYRLPIIDAGREEDGCSYVPRLFRNAPGLFYVGRIHEQVFSSIEVRRHEWGMENCLGAAALRHHGYTPEVSRTRNKKARNLALLERAIEEAPNEPNLIMNYGLELARCGRIKEGLEYYWEAFHMMSALPADQIVPELRETLLTQLTTNLLNLKDHNGILSVLQSPFAKKSGLTASLHFILGLALLELKQFSEAGEQFQFCLNKRERPALSPIHKEIRKAAPRHCLAICQKMLNQPEAAAKTYTAALEEDSKSIPLRIDYARFLAETNEPLAALKLLNGILAEQPKHLAAWLTGGRIALSQRDLHEFAGEWTGEAVKHFPTDAAALLQRAEALMLNQQMEAALVLWRKISLPGPRYVAARAFCELIAGSEWSVASAQEPQVSAEFVAWYRYFLERGATAPVGRLHELLPQLRKSLPTAASLLAQAFDDAAKDVV